MTELVSLPIAEQSEPNRYNVNDVVKLLLNSFRFSQGNIVLQDALLRRVEVITHGRIGTETIEQALEPAYEAALKILRSKEDPSSKLKAHARISETDDYIKEQVTKFGNYLAKSWPDQIRDVHDISRGVIDRDYKFLISRDGRERADAERVKPSNDPFLSHFVYYGLMKQTTGSPEYDQIFAEAVDFFNNYQGPSHEDDVSRVQQLIIAYLEHHPHQSSLLPDEYKPLAEAA